MNLYAILRRDGFADGPTLEAAAARSTAEGDKVPNDIRWIRSYVLARTAARWEPSVFTRRRVKMRFERMQKQPICQSPRLSLSLTR